MESREAIEVLTDKNTTYGTLKCDDMAWRKLKPAIDTAVKALEKQISKKVIVVRAKNEKESVSTGDYVHYKCPNCEKKIGSAFHYPPNEYMMEHKFCDECGQGLDWSDTD